MNRFRKTKAQLNRERLEKQEREAKERRLKNKLGFVPDVVNTKEEIYKPRPQWRPDDKIIPSKNSGIEPSHNAKAQLKYEGEMAEREAEAQKEIEAKKKRVAPLFNKGGYQFITDGTDPKDIGRKTSSLND